MQFYTFKFPENAKCIKIRSLSLNVLAVRPRGSVLNTISVLLYLLIHHSLFNVHRLK